MKFEGCGDFRYWLSEQGFKLYVNYHNYGNNACNWYAAKTTKLPARECEQNNRPPSVFIWPYKSTCDSYSGAEVEIRAEVNQLWFQLRSIGLTQEEITQKLPEIEVALVNAWNALAQVEE